MSATRKRICLGWLVLHLFFIFVVSSRDLLGLLADGGNVFPKAMLTTWTRGEQVASSALGEFLGRSNALRQAKEFYVQSAGIDSGYSFFAPNVPNSYKLVFEIQHPNGTTEMDLPEVGGTAAGLRLATLLENLGQIHLELLRQRTIEKLSYSAWANHPDATRIRAIFGAVLVPEPAQFLRGGKESYEVICAYDFFPRRPASPK